MFPGEFEASKRYELFKKIHHFQEVACFTSFFQGLQKAEGSISFSQSFSSLRPGRIMPKTRVFYV